MGKLHQHLAVEDAKATNFKSTMEEAITSFSKRDHLFKGRVVSQTSRLQDTDDLYPEYPNISSVTPCAETVMGKISWVIEHASQYFDLTAQKDLANCNAKADLIINGKVILSNLPAVTLLFIENKMKSIRNMIQSAPTLDAAAVWKKHEGQPNVWEGEPKTKLVKQIVKDWRIIVNATDKHPAQVQQIDEEKVRATNETKELRGFFHTEEKANLLMRCDEIIQAAKQARQTANDQVVDGNTKISDALFNYLLKGN